MKRKGLLIIATLLTWFSGTASAQKFNEWFTDCTLRLDYILAGDNHTQEIFFEKALKTTRWAGRQNRLSEMPLKGDGQLTVADAESGQILYAHTFSTLFQEWQATEEATQVKKAFQLSCQIPFPLRPVKVTITLTNSHAEIVGRLTHTVNPQDILIRQATNPGYPYRYLLKTDSIANLAHNIDLAIVAEGYTEAEMPKFYADCNRTVEALFSHEPFTSLKQRFNIVAVAPSSADSGPSIPHQGRWSRTPIGTHYDTFYSERYLMTEDMHRLYDVLVAVPFEHVIVLVNSSEYGGGGIYNQLNVFACDHPTFRQVLVHEFGHGYAGLGDEYAYDENYETVYPPDTEPWEPNLTTRVNFEQKWADMLPDPSGTVGLYEGGGNQSKGVWRPSPNCRMRSNDATHFCPVCTRAIQRITDFYTSY